MQPQQNAVPNPSGDQSGQVVCSQCGAPMPKEMRFCRSCGNRLGEGSAEYTETVLLPNSPNAYARVSDPFRPGYTAPIMPGMTTAVTRPRRRRLSGMTWVFIALAFFFAGGGALSMLKKARTNIPAIVRTTVDRSFFGVDDFETADGGASFQNVEPPGGPADKAGLVGGDIITSFDGHAISDSDEIMDLLTQTPVGKRVEVIYTRDGNFHNTQLITVSREEFNRLDTAFQNRPEGKGMFGFERDRTTRINNPETKTFGVRMDYVQPNGPADLFGIKAGDIITDFDNVPIRTSDELLSRVRRAIPYGTVNVTLLRDGKPMVIPVKVGKAR